MYRRKAQTCGTTRNLRHPNGSAETIAFDHRWNLCRSRAGTPSISAMTVVGIGSA